jgi:hypothetical protein
MQCFHGVLDIITGLMLSFGEAARLMTAPIAHPVPVAMQKRITQGLMDLCSAAAESLGREMSQLANIRDRD